MEFPIELNTELEARANLQDKTLEESFVELDYCPTMYMTQEEIREYTLEEELPW